jgi:hypothetical protein
MYINIYIFLCILIHTCLLINEHAWLENSFYYKCICNILIQVSIYLPLLLRGRVEHLLRLDVCFQRTAGLIQRQGTVARRPDSATHHGE